MVYNFLTAGYFFSEQYLGNDNNNIDTLIILKLLNKLVSFD